MMFILFVLAVLVGRAEAFYLPGVAPKDYAKAREAQRREREVDAQTSE